MLAMDKPKLEATAIAALVDQGYGTLRMARVFGVSTMAVWRYAHNAGIVLRGSYRRGHGLADPQGATPAGRGPARPKVDPAELAALVAAGLRVAQIERALHVHRATLHRVARAAGIDLPKPRTRPSREACVALIVEHGLSVAAIAAALGLRRDYVRRVLVEHGLLLTWWGWRRGRYAEWTANEGED